MGVLDGAFCCNYVCFSQHYMWVKCALLFFYSQDLSRDAENILYILFANIDMHETYMVELYMLYFIIKPSRFDICIYLNRFLFTSCKKYFFDSFLFIILRNFFYFFLPVIFDNQESIYYVFFFVYSYYPYKYLTSFNTIWLFIKNKLVNITYLF